MADNVTFQSSTLATPPDATVVATDEVGARHFQLVKQVFGGDGTATLVSAADPLPITIISGSSSGTEYTENDTDASITGTAMLMEGAADTLVTVRGTATDGLLVNLGSNNDVVISDGGNSITVDGTVAATLSEPISVDDNGGSLTVDGTVAATQSGAWNVGDITGTVSLPTGASTSANQTTIIGHLDGVEGLLTTIDADTGNIVTSVQLLDDTVFAEDTAAQAADKGIAVLAVRRDADTALVGADNDYANLQVDANGALKVEIFDGGGSHTVDNNGTFAVQAAQSGTWNITDISGTVSLPTGAATAANQSTMITALQLIDDTVFAEDVAAQAADKGVAVLAVRRDADTSLVGADNDYANLQVNANGALKVEIFDGGDSHTVDNNGTFATQATLQTGDNVVGRVKLTDGTDVVDVLDLSNSNPLVVAVVNGDGDQITAFGAGTQYTEDAAAAANPIGTALNLIRADTLAGVTSTDGDNVAARGTDNGELYVKHVDDVNIADGGNSITVDGTVAATQSGAWAITDITGTVSLPTGASTAAKQDTIIGHVDGIEGLLTTIDANTGNIVTSVQLLDNASITDDAAFTAGTTGVTMAGFFADDASTDSVNEGDGGAARMTLDRKVITSPQPYTTGGLSIFRSLDLDETEEAVKATAGQVYSCWVTNTSDSTRFLKFYNATTANTTVGTTTPLITIGIPGNTSDDVSGVFTGGGYGITFDTAITVAATTGVADNDTGAPGANEVIVNVFYA